MAASTNGEPPTPRRGPRPGVLRYSSLFGVTMTVSVGLGIAVAGDTRPLPLGSVILAMIVNFAVGSHLSVLLAQGEGDFRR